MIARAACALALSAGPAVAQALPAGPGTGFTVARYDVALRPDLATTAVAGSETITVRATAARLTRLRFSPTALRMTDATVDGAPVAISATADALEFALPRPLPRGARATLRLRFAGTPARGINRIAGGIATGYFACDWMVCLQDAPGAKARLTLDLFVPPGVATLGSGRLTRASAAVAGLRRHRWQLDRPASAYLFAFAAGHFATVTSNTGRARFAYADATGGGADLATLFAPTPAIAAFLAAKAGLALPDRRYVQLLVPGDAAQETAGFSLIGQNPLTADRDDPDGAWVIAHEMAHQWWGNLVTCANWQELWLNEGIATFMTAAWQEHAHGAAAYRRALDGARRRVERARAIGFDRPLAWPGRYPTLAVRRAVQYSKGALFLAQLRETLGDAAFWRGLGAFTRRHAGRNATSRDFQRAMEAASGRDLAPLFAAWVYGA